MIITPEELEAFLGERWWSAATCRSLAYAILARYDVRLKDQPRSGRVDGDDPSADERWNAGCDFAMLQLCTFLGVDPHMVSWDAATETVDGDVRAVIGNILHAKLGEDWDPRATPQQSGNSGEDEDFGDMPSAYLAARCITPKPAPDAMREALETIKRTTFSGSEMGEEYIRGNRDAHATCAAMAKRALTAPVPSPEGAGERHETIHTIAHDGFAGNIIGRYTTREGKEGVVLQQVGTRVVHVYGEKWLK